MNIILDRLLKIGDATSQWFNVVFFPNISDTNANESISGRSYRCNWKLMKVIDALLYIFEKEHCKKSYYKDLERATELKRRHDERLIP